MPFAVIRIAPARCPACMRPFSSDAAFGVYAPGHGDSFAQAQADAMARFPEVYGTEDEPGIEGRFIRCDACRNVTLRVTLAERQVQTRADAERLIGEEGYTAFAHIEVPEDLSAGGGAEDDQRWG